VYCTINSNFTLVDEGVLKEIMVSGVKKLLVSLWAGGSGIYRKTHPGVKVGTFERACRNLRTLIRLRGGGEFPEVTLVNVISSYNVSDFENMVQLGIELGVDSAWFTPVDAAQSGASGLPLSAEQLRELREAALRCASKYGGSTTDERRIFRINQLDGFIEKISSSGAAEG
jgi:MoaA/NifB/PqqE/SkfB family radical SAM enzyme